MSRSEQRDATRREVLTVAEGLFLERGFDATTVRDIAAAAGVSVGTVMSVGDKRALLAAVFERGISLVDERRAMERAESGERRDASGGDSVARIVDLVRPYLKLFASRIDLARAYGAVLMDGTHGGGVFGVLGAALQHEIARVLRDAARPHPAPEAAARAIHLVYLGSIFEWAGRGEADAARALTGFRDAVAVIVDERSAP